MDAERAALKDANEALEDKLEHEEAERIAAFLASEQLRIETYEAEKKLNETAHASWT